VCAEFDKILRLLQKASLSTLPGTTVFLPPQFLAILSTLPADVDESIKAEKTAAKKSSTANAKALNSMKQKVKKAAKEFEENLTSYKTVRFTLSSANLPFLQLTFDHSPPVAERRGVYRRLPRCQQDCRRARQEGQEA
jgi:hypothetical protein